MTLLMLMALITPDMADTTQNMALQFLPRAIHGWKAAIKAEIYNRETIYDYMNGAGEIYLAYRFSELLVRRYSKPRNPDIIVEIFDMDSPEDAFGVFSHGQGREKGERDIGEDSEYGGGLLCFWKDKFYVCIYAERETSTSKRAVFSLGRMIAGAMKTKGEKPKLPDYLPREGLIEKSICYFYNHTILNLHYFVADRNILGLNEQTRAVLASYDDKSHILLVRYESTEKATAAYESFVDAYAPEAVNSGIIQTENGKWTGVRVEQKFVSIVFDAPTKDDAERKLKYLGEKFDGH